MYSRSFAADIREASITSPACSFTEALSTVGVGGGRCTARSGRRMRTSSTTSRATVPTRRSRRPHRRHVREAVGRPRAELVRVLLRVGLDGVRRRGGQSCPRGGRGTTADPSTLAYRSLMRFSSSDFGS